MEVKEKSKKRELIKTIAIVFLAVLLVLTLFSNTIMNYSLPEVATQRITSGTINARIRGSGTVAATESYEVIIDQTREVRTVCVKVGDSVEQGDVLFVLGDMESTELQTAQQTLDELTNSYQKQLLTLSKTYASDDREVEKMQEDLEKYTKQRDENLVTDDDLAYIRADIKAAEGDLREYTRALEDLNDMLADNEAYTSAQTAVHDAEGEIDTVEGAIQKLQDDIKTLQDALNGDIDIDAAAGRNVQDAQAALEAATYQWRSDWLAYYRDLTELFLAAHQAYPQLSIPAFSSSQPYTMAPEQQMYVEAFLTEQGRIQPSTGGQGTVPGGSGESGTVPGGSGTNTPAAGGEATDTPSTAAETADTETANPETGDQEPAFDYTGCKEAYDTLLADQEAVTAAQQKLSRLMEDQYDAAGDVYADRAKTQQQLSEKQAELNMKDGELLAAQARLQQAQAQLEQEEANIADLKISIKNYEDIQQDQNDYITDLKQEQTDLEAKKTLYDAAVEQITATQRSLEDYLTGKDIDKQLNNLDLQAMRDQIERQQAAVDKLKADVIDTEVKANVSGTVTAINVSAGKETTAGSAMAVIDVVDRGYTVRVSVTREQAQQVKPGDTAEVTNYYGWGRTLEATLEQIVADPESQGQRRILVFRVTGDVDPGTNITLSIGQRSTTMDTIVPKSALREDSNGHFVLVVTSRSTPLGNRYTATRVDVEVLAEDDTNAAVSGLTANDYVITTSSAPLAAGSQVRLVEDPS